MLFVMCQLPAQWRCLSSIKPLHPYAFVGVQSGEWRAGSSCQSKTERSIKSGAFLIRSPGQLRSRQPGHKHNYSFMRVELQSIDETFFLKMDYITVCTWKHWLPELRVFTDLTALKALIRAANIQSKCLAPAGKKEVSLLLWSSIPVSLRRLWALVSSL